MTTGTTAAECARVLRRAGAATVWVATVARTLKLEPTLRVPMQDEESEVMMHRSQTGGRIEPTG
jgi:glutamine phosphoribosylpyrophosphate amidotransferase